MIRSVPAVRSCSCRFCAGACDRARPGPAVPRRRAATAAAIVTVVPGPAQRVTILEGSSQFTRIRVERDGKLRIDTCNGRLPAALSTCSVEIETPSVPDAGVSTAAERSRDGERICARNSRAVAAVNGGGTDRRARGRRRRRLRCGQRRRRAVRSAACNAVWLRPRRRRRFATGAIRR